MSPLWVLPLAVGAAGAVALALANRKLGREVEALRRNWGSGRARSCPATPGGRRTAREPGQ